MCIIGMTNNKTCNWEYRDLYIIEKQEIEKTYGKFELVTKDRNLLTIKCENRVIKLNQYLKVVA